MLNLVDGGRGPSLGLLRCCVLGVGVVLVAACGAGQQSETPTESECGNGIVESTEACDDGFRTNCGVCNSDCSAAGFTSVCGDGSTCIDNERCDDGNTEDGDYCSSDCSALTGACGDGELQVHEVCDDGNRLEGDYCSGDCMGIIGSCGDGRVQSNEICDDGFVDACGSCNADCTAAGLEVICGDGTVCPELEACDDGYTDSCGTCNSDCSGQGQRGICGDGSVCPETEKCDDRHTDSCGTCNADCSGPGDGATCGDGLVCPELEICDDGFADSCGTCNATCDAPGVASACGDGAWCLETEACDDGNVSSGDYCSVNCRAVTGSCGDGTIQFNERCDDGNTRSGDYCGVDCLIVTGRCGDGVQQTNEACDDGYMDACGSCNADCTSQGTGAICGDGAFCPQLEICDDGYTDACGSCNDDCTSQGTGATCGDGLSCPELEACDDGNLEAMDYCAADCSAVTGACGDGVLQINESCELGDGWEALATVSCQSLDASTAAGDASCQTNCTYVGECRCEGAGAYFDGGSCLPYPQGWCAFASCYPESTHGLTGSRYGARDSLDADGGVSGRVVEDAVTQLTWQYSYERRLALVGAFVICDALELDGHTDWRLPQIHELRSMVDDNEANPSVSEAFGAPESVGFWSSTPVANDDGRAWGVELNAGASNHYPTDALNAVRCVRGGVGPADGAASPDEVLRFVTRPVGSDAREAVDVVTGLAWHVPDLVESQQIGSWSDAVEHCESLALSDADVWRLPTLVELAGIINYGFVDPATTLPGAQSTSYWTATQFSGHDASSWWVDLDMGTVGHTSESVTMGIRCVRD